MPTASTHGPRSFRPRSGVACGLACRTSSRLVGRILRWTPARRRPRALPCTTAESTRATPWRGSPTGRSHEERRNRATSTDSRALSHQKPSSNYRSSYKHLPENTRSYDSSGGRPPACNSQRTDGEPKGSREPSHTNGAAWQHYRAQCQRYRPWPTVWILSAATPSLRRGGKN
jgi:hypothetical protein